jgi:hypothetical protein
MLSSLLPVIPNVNRRLIVEFAAKNRLATMYAFVEGGAGNGAIGRHGLH